MDTGIDAGWMNAGANVMQRGAVRIEILRVKIPAPFVIPIITMLQSHSTIYSHVLNDWRFVIHQPSNPPVVHTYREQNTKNANPPPFVLDNVNADKHSGRSSSYSSHSQIERHTITRTVSSFGSM